MNNDPKAILPKATRFPDSSFKVCLLRMFSVAQNRVAINISSSPLPKLKAFILSKK